MKHVMNIWNAPEKGIILQVEQGLYNTAKRSFALSPNCMPTHWKQVLTQIGNCQYKAQV